MKRGRQVARAALGGAMATTMGMGMAVGLGGIAGASTPPGSAPGSRSAAATGATRASTSSRPSTNGSSSTQAGGASSGAHSASGGPRSTRRRARLAKALARRETLLSKMTSSVLKSKVLSASERQALESELAAETAGIRGLAAAVPGEPSTQLSTSASTMVGQYRVHSVMARKVHLTEHAARQAAAELKATNAEPKIDARIQAAQAKGETVQAAVHAYQDLVSMLSQATADTQAAGIQAVVSASPSGYPGDAGAFTAARSQLRSARSRVSEARSDLATIRSTLKASGARAHG